jgi:hypothetical protein
MPINQTKLQIAVTNGRAKCAPIVIFALGALSSCTNSVGGRDDQERIAGVYTVQSVDGAPIPAPIAPQQGCNRTVQKGIFTLSPAGPDVVPQYDWTINIAANCQPVPSGVDQGSDDVGNWRFRSSTALAFSSLMSHGSYQATLEESVGSQPAITFAYAGNSYRFVRIMRFDDPQGVVFVDVVDQFGQPVEGVVLQYVFANGLQAGGTTPSSGEIGNRGVVGECRISVTPPSGYSVPTSQSNPISVTVLDGQAIHVNVTLTKL